MEGGVHGPPKRKATGDHVNAQLRQKWVGDGTQESRPGEVRGRDEGGKVIGSWAGESVRLPERSFQECKSFFPRRGSGADVGPLSS